MNSTSSVANDLQTGAARVADAFSDISENASERASEFAQGAADSVREATKYVRDNGSQLGDQIKTYLKANPNHALIGAAVVGFFLGRLMSRD